MTENINKANENIGLIAVVCIILGLIFSVFLKTLSFDLTWLDDYYLIETAKPFLSDTSNLYKLFFTDAFITNPIGLYRPLLNVSYMFDMSFGVSSFFVFHLTSLILHIAAVFLLFLLLKKIHVENFTAIILTAAFSVHPSAATAVAWLPGRNDTMLAIFIFAAFMFFLNYCERQRIKDILLYSLFLMFALFTKESAVIMPFLCLAYNYFYDVKIQKKEIKKSVVFSIVPIIIWYVFRFNAHILDTSVSIYATLKNICYLPVLLGKTILPIFPKVVSDYNSLAYPLFFGIFGVAACFVIYRFTAAEAKKKFLFGFTWFLLFIIPTMLAGDTIVSGNSFFEHRLYLPFAGLCICLSNLRIASKKIKYFRISALLFVLFLGIISSFYTENYRDKYSFWSKAVIDMPNDYATFVRASQISRTKFLYGEAEYYLKKSIELNPKAELVHAQLASLYYQTKKYDLAEKAMEEELKVNPDYQIGRQWLKKMRELNRKVRK